MPTIAQLRIQFFWTSGPPPSNCQSKPASWILAKFLIFIMPTSISNDFSYISIHANNFLQITNITNLKELVIQNLAINMRDMRFIADKEIWGSFNILPNLERFNFEKVFGYYITFAYGSTYSLELCNARCQKCIGYYPD